MRSKGFVPVSAEMRSRRTRPPKPPTDATPKPGPIPRRSSILPLPGRPCHFMVHPFPLQGPTSEEDAHTIPAEVREPIELMLSYAASGVTAYRDLLSILSSSSRLGRDASPPLLGPFRGLMSNARARRS